MAGRAACAQLMCLTASVARIYFVFVHSLACLQTREQQTRTKKYTCSSACPTPGAALDGGPAAPLQMPPGATRCRSARRLAWHMLSGRGAQRASGRTCAEDRREGGRGTRGAKERRVGEGRREQAEVCVGNDHAGADSLTQSST